MSEPSGVNQGGETAQPASKEFASPPTGSPDPDTLAAVQAIVTYAREGAPEVPERLVYHAALVGGLVASALVEGDFALGNTPATVRLARVQRRIDAYSR